MVEDLKILKELLENKLITTEEFEKKKKEILFTPHKDKTFMHWAVEFFKYVSWPIVVIIAITVFYHPINTKLLESQEIKVGSFYLKIKDEAAKKGDEKLANIIVGLSTDAIRVFLEFASSGYSIRMVSSSDGDTNYTYLMKQMTIYQELEKNGLIKSSENLVDFDKFFFSLKPNQKVVWIKPKGVPNMWSYDRYEDRVPNVLVSLNRSSLSKSNDERIGKLTIALTEKGEKALDIIVDVATHAISTEKQM